MARITALIIKARCTFQKGAYCVRKLIVVKRVYQLYKYVRQYLLYLWEFMEFIKISRIRSDFTIGWKDRYPCLNDKTTSTSFDRHYVFHTAWAARCVVQYKPTKHIDISSSLYFCSILSAYVPVEFYDYRPAKLDLDNLKSQHGDLLHLPFKDGEVSSISCMHVIEHVGLGRYGDCLDSVGDLRAIAELRRVLAPNGHLLFVVPVGQQKVAFNAHRIYSYEQIVGYFSDLMLNEFSLIPDTEIAGGLVRHADPSLVKIQNYACGCFWFQKPASNVI